MMAEHTFVTRRIVLGSTSDPSLVMIFSRLWFKVHPPQEVTPVIGFSVHVSCEAESDLKPTIAWTKDASLHFL